MSNHLTIIRRSVLPLAVLVLASSAAFSQARVSPPLVAAPRPQPPAVVATGNDLYCAGFIQTSPIATGSKLIGGQDEADRFVYAQNDLLYINEGQDRGVRVGDVFSVVRPRGTVKSKFSHKGDLGFYVQEVGSVEVLKVKANTSAVRVKWSCDNFLLGDLVHRREQRTSPIVSGGVFDVFGDASGKPTGRIVMARDGAEALAKNFIAYVDLGAEDRVQVGDTLTIFRLLEKGNITLKPDREAVSARDYGFESDEYKGGKFSNQAARKSGDRATGQEVRTRDVRNERPDGMRKVVGEAVVLNVKERTATVKITRNAQEIHTGDWVEIK